MCSALQLGPRWVSVAQLVEFGHRSLREVAAGDGPFVVLVGEHGADEAGQRARRAYSFESGTYHSPRFTPR